MITNPEVKYPETVEDARLWVDELRGALRGERAYIQELERDLSLLKDAVETVLYQGQLHKTTMRRILRGASAATRFGVNRPYELSHVPDFRLEQITEMQLRHKGLFK